MSALALVQLVIVLLGGVATAAGKAGFIDIVTAAQAAIAELQKVHGSDVTKGQLDSLSVTPQW